MTRRPVRIPLRRPLLELAEESYRNTGLRRYQPLEPRDRRLSALHRARAAPQPPLRPPRRRTLVPVASRRHRAPASSRRDGRGPQRRHNHRRRGRHRAPARRRQQGHHRGRHPRRRPQRLRGRLEPRQTVLHGGSPRPRRSPTSKPSPASSGKSSPSASRSAKSPGVSVSVAPFIPKPGTPFQWEPMASREYLEDARGILMRAFRGSPAKVSVHEIDRSFLEGALARGGRDLCAVMEKAADLGCRLDAWDEYFDYSKWQAGLRLRRPRPRGIRRAAASPSTSRSPGRTSPQASATRSSSASATMPSKRSSPPTAAKPAAAPAASPPRTATAPDSSLSASIRRYESPRLPARRRGTGRRERPDDVGRRRCRVNDLPVRAGPRPSPSLPKETPSLCRFTARVPPFVCEGAVRL